MTLPLLDSHYNLLSEHKIEDSKNIMIISIYFTAQILIKIIHRIFSNLIRNPNLIRASFCRFLKRKKKKVSSRF